MELSEHTKIGHVKKKLTHKDIVSLLERSIAGGWTTLLTGRPGTGKSSMVEQAALAQKIKRGELKVLMAPLIDPFTDLIGIPIPKQTKYMKGEKELTRTVVKYARPEFFYDAKVLFLDEINRAPPKTINAILELVQFRSLCGVKLPKLECVILAGNEPEPGLLADPFEGALVDRVHMILKVPYIPDEEYFRKRFVEKLCNALLQWWRDDLDPNQKNTISPRRLEIIGANIERDVPPEYSDTNETMGRDIMIPWAGLQARIQSGYIPLERFTTDIPKYKALVKKDMEVANQFLLSLNLFSDKDLNNVKEIAIELPKEMLKSVMQNEILWNKILKCITKNESLDDSRLWAKSCRERIK